MSAGKRDAGSRTRVGAAAVLADPGFAPSTPTALDAFPAFSEPYARLARALDVVPVPTAAAVGAVEGDVALGFQVLRAANALPGAWQGEVDSIVRAVTLLQGPGLRAALRGLPTTDYFADPAPWGGVPERLRRHTAATVRAADLLAVRTGLADRDRLITAALLHDVGVAVLTARDPAYVPWQGRDPRIRVRSERAALGIDHAAAGAEVLRQAGVAPGIVDAVAEHHTPGARGLAAYVRAADLLAHEALGDEPPIAGLRDAARAIGLGRADLRALVFDLPQTGALPERVVDPCPLSLREQQVLGSLAGGSVYKQIAQDLNLSTSTVRTHLHNIYGKLGAVDRAQAVLIARQRGWL
jgi:putative nucleotidyltransferase with HDIG domain